MGNPNAPVKLVEYASITCPHCGEFARRRRPRCASQLCQERPGQLGISAAHAVPDRSRHLRACCNAAAPSPSSSWSSSFMPIRRTGSGASSNMRRRTAPRSKRWPRRQRAAALVRGAGLDQFFRQRGMPAGQIDSCLAEPAESPAHRRADPARHPGARVTGTPTFFINGNKLENVGTWEALEPLLRARWEAEMKQSRDPHRRFGRPRVALPAAPSFAQRRGTVGRGGEVRAARPARLDPDRRSARPKAASHRQSQCAGEAGRISLADLPALRRIRASERPAAVPGPCARRPGQRRISQLLPRRPRHRRGRCSPAARRRALFRHDPAALGSPAAMDGPGQTADRRRSAPSSAGCRRRRSRSG